ncbi:four helix bundle suffix domain-containing protein [Cellulosispirillum alkaliphilum]|uniref:four helix bundle suffix domain-containing protein n=1 Tax=Cellulosispirillum alkaliphilum TaxID=3039283 RepID=UPI003D6F7DB8
MFQAKEPQHPALERFKELRCKTLEKVQGWVVQERKRSTDTHRLERTSGTNDENRSARHVSASPCSTLSSACLAANAAMSLLNLATYLLDRQVERLAKDFETEDGFTERLYNQKC